jgi:hypothetical protein
MTWFFMLLFVSFLGWSSYGWVRARRALARARQIREQLGETARTSIRDAPVSGRIVISGRARSAADALVTAPFSGGEALWARAWLQTNVGGVIREWVEEVDEIVIDDGSGRIARVEPSKLAIRLAERSVGDAENAERIGRYLANWGSSRSGFPYESVLRPDEHVSVMGSVAPSQAGYRESDDALRFSNDDEILMFDSMLEPGATERAQRLAGCALFGVVAFAIATAVTIAAMVGD